MIHFDDSFIHAFIHSMSSFIRICPYYAQNENTVPAVDQYIQRPNKTKENTQSWFIPKDDSSSGPPTCFFLILRAEHRVLRFDFRNDLLDVRPKEYK